MAYINGLWKKTIVFFQSALTLVLNLMHFDTFYQSAYFFKVRYNRAF